MEEITLYGCGGHCNAVIALIQQDATFEIRSVLDDFSSQKFIDKIPVRKSIKKDDTPKNMCITIGDNQLRKKIASQFNAVYPSFVHSSTIKYPSVVIGKGTVVLLRAVLDAGVSIGDFCIINNSATLSHNVVVEDFVHIAIQAAITGGVHIKEGAFIAAGSIILPNITIGKWATVGAGAVITKDVPDYAVVYGNPAKIIRYNNK